MFKLQKHFYKAAQRGDKQNVRKLQRLLTKSWSAKCLAVRRVTQDNNGKNTASVDGVKTISPKERLEMRMVESRCGRCRTNTTKVDR